LAVRYMLAKALATTHWPLPWDHRIVGSWDRASGQMRHPRGQTGDGAGNLGQQPQPAEPASSSRWLRLAA